MILKHCRRMEWAGVWTVAILLSLVDQVTAQGNNGSLSGLAIGLIVAGAVIFLIIIIVAGLCCFNYKRKHLGHLEFEHPEFERSGEPYFRTSSLSRDPEPEPIQYDAPIIEKQLDRPAAADSDGGAVSADDVIVASPKTGKKGKFEEQLLELQAHAVTFNEMLKDVQERIKTAKHGNPRVHSYKAVSRDLSRVQHLLSKRSSTALKMPPDGVELLAWATEAEEKYLELQRYKSQKDSGRTELPEMASIMWIQSKDDSAFEDKSFDESAVI